MALKCLEIEVLFSSVVVGCMFICPKYDDKNLPENYFGPNGDL
jgi:hypothetical protein